MERPLSPRILALALLACSLVCWVGCGDDARTLSTSSMTNAQFANQVETICARGRQRGLRFQPPRAAKSERDALTEAIEDNLLPSLQSVVDEIYALGAPRSKEASTEALLVALQKGIDRGEQLQAPTLESIEGLLAQSGKLARNDGLASCVYG